MNSKVKMLVSVLAFVLVVSGAVLAYNIFSERLEDEPSGEQGSTGGSPGNAGSNSTAGNPADSNGQKAPDLTLVDIDGNEVRISDMIGKPIVLNFWASWCPPCRRGMPDFDRVYKELGDEVKIMMINLTGSRGETVERAKNYVAGQGYSFPVYFDTRMMSNAAYGIRSIPLTVFIDRDGYIVSRETGINESRLRSNISELGISSSQ